MIFQKAAGRQCREGARMMAQAEHESTCFQTEDLAVGYQGKALVSGISLSLQPGKILTLVGPNGCGKSTLLKTIVRQLERVGGVIYIDGKAASQVNPTEFSKVLAMVLTDRPKTELMSCRDVVSTGRYPYTGRLGILSQQDWEEVDMAIELVQAREISEQDFMCISDGQKQRILMARALCQETKILVLDEPTSFLDVHFKQEILTMIRMLAREKQLAVIMSLHEPDLMRFISDTVACIRDGRIDRLGPPEEIFKDDYVEKLYQIEDGTFDPLTGTVSLRLSQGEPRVFVIGGGGDGVGVCNRLQRENVPFAAGILQENDVEYHAVKALTEYVICAEAFSMPTQDQITQAKQQIDQCEFTLCPLTHFGEQNACNAQLKAYAAEQGKLREIEEWLRSL